MHYLLFFRWYYSDGARDGFTNVVNFVRFIVHRFNTGELIRTLFFPWKRDITYKHHPGFHPARSVARGISNVTSRFMGLCVRIPVIVAGIAGILMGAVVVSTVYVWFMLSPLFVLIGVFRWNVFGGLIFEQQLLLSGLFGVVFGLLCYFLRTPRFEVLENMNFDTLRDELWFHRVLARLGMETSDVPEDALVSIGSFMTLLKMRNIEPETFAIALDIEQREFIRRGRAWRFWLWENYQKKQPIGKGWRFGYTPYLDRYCVDVSRSDKTEYGKMDLIGRQAEFRVATVVLERPEQNNVFLVGEPGIGKKMFLHHLARMIRENAFPRWNATNYLRVLFFNIGEAIDEVLSQGGNPQESLRRMFQEATSAGNILLIVEDIDLFLGADPQKVNISHLLGEFLSFPDFRFLGTAVAARYHALAKRDEQILKYFETIYLRQPNIAENREILIQYFEHSERRQVVLTLKAIETIIMSSRRYNWEMPYPERVLDLAQQVMIYFRSQSGRFLTEQVVNEYISLKTGIPSGEVTDDEREKLLNLESSLHERIVGQNEAVNQVSQVLRKARAGFHDPKRPLGSFLFMGPTGVGKTETVKALAESIFGT